MVKLLKGLDPENEDHYHKILECEGRLLALLPTGMAEQVKVATEAVKTARLSSTAVDQLTEPLRQQVGGRGRVGDGRGRARAGGTGSSGGGRETLKTHVAMHAPAPRWKACPSPRTCR